MGGINYLNQAWGEEEWEEWPEASSCSCERVFSYITASDYGQPTNIMTETLWVRVRCNGPAVEDFPIPHHTTPLYNETT